MAKSQLAHPANAPGDFYVDTRCIDCPVCRQIAPQVFRDGPGQAIVAHQPATDQERLRAFMALVSCPAGSIGSRSGLDAKAAFEALPELLEDNVYYCGFSSPDAFGAHSYFIKHPGGNILVDSPRFTNPLVQRLEKMGGIRWMLLTHRDDAADHALFARQFGCERVLHETDAIGTLTACERQLSEEGPWELTPDLKIIRVPGHTRGHLVFLYRNAYLFSGDHLFWRPEVNSLDTSHQYNQYSWETQIKSVEKLLHENFTWILPGHGYRYQADPPAMRQAISKAIDLMRRGRQLK